MAGFMDFLTAVPRALGTVRQAYFDPFDLKMQALETNKADAEYKRLRDIASTIQSNTPEADVMIDAMLKSPVLSDEQRQQFAQIKQRRMDNIRQDVVANTGPKRFWDIPADTLMSPDLRFSDFAKNPNYEPPTSIWGNQFSMSDPKVDSYAALAESRRASAGKYDAEAESKRAMLDPTISLMKARANAAKSGANLAEARANETNQILQPTIDKINAQTEKTKSDIDRQRQRIKYDGDILELKSTDQKIKYLKDLIETSKDEFGMVADQDTYDYAVAKLKALGLDTQSNPSGEDAQALEWAKQNPNDPRAKQIMQLLGN